MVRTELRALVKVFFKLKEEPQNFFEELRVTVRACDPKVLHLSQLAHMLAGLGEAPKWMQEAKRKTPRMIFKVGKNPLREGVTTYPSILAWRIPMDRGAWQGYSLRGHKELDMT